MERNWLYVFISVNANSVYVQYKVNVSENQVITLKDAIRLKKGVILCFPKDDIRGDYVLLLTPAQINRLDRAHAEEWHVQIRMSARQVAKNASYIGGFFRYFGITGCSCYTTFCDGLFLKHGHDISDGAGLLMGKNSPFKNIPVLGWLM